MRTGGTRKYVGNKGYATRVRENAEASRGEQANATTQSLETIPIIAQIVVATAVVRTTLVPRPDNCDALMARSVEGLR